MCKILAHQPNLLPPPGGGQPINAGPSVETWMENRSWETLSLVARVISSSCPGLWGPCPDRPLQLIGHGGRDWGEVHCFVLGRTPAEGKGYPIQHSGLENAMDCIVHGVAKSQTTERLSLSLQLLCGLDLACGHPWQGLWDSVGHSPQTVLGPHLTHLPWGLRVG